MAAANSWKQYGGRQYLYSNNHLTASSIVTDDLTILNGYQGNLEINGSLTVLNDIIFQGNVDISNNHVIIGSLHVNQDAVVDGPLNVFGPLGVQDTLLFGTEGSMHADLSNVILDMVDGGYFSVVGPAPHLLSVQSTSEINYNVVASQSTGSAVQVYADVSSSALQFYSHYVDRGVPDVQVELSGGHLFLDAPLTNLTGALSVSAGAVVTDVSAGYYCPSFYSTDISYGRALVLESHYAGGITALEIDRSLTISAGPFPGDKTRSFAALSVLDMSAVPALTMVSGTSSTTNPSTVGINTFSPTTENYVLDVNGPVLLHHNETTLVYTTTFQVLTTVFNGRFEAAMVGSAVPFLPPGADPPIPGFAHPVAYSITAGASWDVSLSDAAIYNNISNSSYTALCGVPGLPLLFVGGQSGSFFYSNDGGGNWHQVIMNGIFYFFQSLYAVSIDSTTIRVFASLYDDTKVNTTTYITYFDFLLSELLAGTEINQFPTLFPQPAYSSITQITGGSVGGLSRVYLFGQYNDGVSSLLTPLDLSLNAAGLFTPVVFPMTPASLFVSSLSQIVVYGGNTVFYAVLTDSLTYGNFLHPTTSFDSSITWNSFYALDSLHSVLVGQQFVGQKLVGVIYTSQNGFNTFQVVPSAILNSQGNVYPLLLYPFVSVFMPDLLHFVFVATYAGFVNRVFYCYWPDVFDPTHNTVLSVSGRMAVSGNLVASNVNSAYSYSSVLESPAATLVNCTITGALQANNFSMSQFTIHDSLTVDNVFTTSGFLQLLNNAAFGGNVAIGGDLSMNSTVLGGRISARGLTNFLDLQQVGASTFTGAVVLNGTTNVNGSLVSSGPVHLSQPLIVDAFVVPSSFTQVGYTFSTVTSSPVAPTQNAYNTASFQNTGPSAVTNVLSLVVPSSGVWMVSALLFFAATGAVPVDTIGFGLSLVTSNLASYVVPLVIQPLFGYTGSNGDSFTVPVNATVVVSGGPVTWYLNASLFARAGVYTSSYTLAGSVILTRVA